MAQGGIRVNSQPVQNADTPFEITEGGPPRYGVLQFIEELPEGRFTYEDLRDRLRANLAESSGIRRLLEEKPDIHGLAVPGMPKGSPGMEGPRTDPYSVISFDKEGKAAVFSRH